MREEFAMPIGHEGPDRAPARLFHAAADADASLCFPLALMPGRIESDHAATTFGAGIGRKLGNASILASQSRTAG